MKAILLYGHGARNPEWAQPFHRIREAIKARDPRALVEPGFLELMRPTFDAGFAYLVAQGATAITGVPIFMAAGSHVKKALPRLAADAMGRHDGLVIELAAPVGEVDSVLAAMADYAMGAQPEG